MGVLYESWVAWDTQRQEINHKQAEQLRPESGEDTWGYLVPRSEMEEPEFKRLRLNTLTVDEIESNLAKIEIGEASRNSVDAAIGNDKDDVATDVGSDHTDDVAAVDTDSAPTWGFWLKDPSHILDYY